MTERVRDKRAVRSAFDRAAASYDRAAVVQREICHRLLDFASPHAPAGDVARVLDAGCGTGYGIDLLAPRFPGMATVALDFAHAMLARLQSRSDDAGCHNATQGARPATLAPQPSRSDGPDVRRSRHADGEGRAVLDASASPLSTDVRTLPRPTDLRALPPCTDPQTLPVCADLEALPLADATVDLAWSSLALQWCDPDHALAEFARVLRPGGCAWIATLGPRTLWELREAFAGIDDAEHVIRFHAAEALLDHAAHAGLAPVAHECTRAAALAPDLRSLLRDIKAIGAHSVGHARRRAPLGRTAWRTLERRYERHRRDDGLLPATYDVILLALRKPE